MVRGQESAETDRDALIGPMQVSTRAHDSSLGVPRCGVRYSRDQACVRTFRRIPSISSNSSWPIVSGGAS